MRRVFPDSTEASKSCGRAFRAFVFERLEGVRIRAGAGAAVAALAILSATAAYACGDSPQPDPTPSPLPTFTPVPPTPVPPQQPDAAALPASDPPVTANRWLPSFADLVEEIQPWVVSITTEQFVRGIFSTFRGDGAGSGFIIRSDGHIVTNEHVIRGAQEIEARLWNGESYTATVVGADVVADIAVLKIDADDLPFATMADKDRVRVGDWVMTLGNALDLKGGPTATLGIVSGIGRTIETEQGQQFFDLIQTDATINSGNSGGPLVDLDGTVIGISQAVLAEARFGFAINAVVAAPIIESLIEIGYVSRPDIGVKGDDIDGEIARSFDLSVRNGVVVTAVDRDGPAYAAGVRVGDVISKLDDIPTPDLAAFKRLLWKYDPGDDVVIEYIRGNTANAATATLGREQPAQ